jgi:hypothetical protein
MLKNGTRFPNVVIMLADNMGYGELGAYGSGGEMRGMPTPHDQVQVAVRVYGLGLKGQVVIRLP